MSTQGDTAATPAEEGSAVSTDPDRPDGTGPDDVDGVDHTASDRPGLGRRIRTIVAGGSEPLTREHRRWIIAIVAVAGALRLAWAIYATKEPLSIMAGGDAYGYYYYGKQIAAGGGYMHVLETDRATAFYPIGYPGFLGFLFWIVQHTPIPDNLPMVGSLVHVVLSTASVFFVFAIGRRLFDIRVGLVAAAVLAFFPNIIFYVATFQLETVFIFLTLLLVLVAISHDWRSGLPSRRYLMGFGALLAVTANVRPFVLPFLVGLGVTALVAGLGWRKALTAVAWPALVLVVICTPWTIRNQVAMGAPMPFSSNGGDTFCMDRGPGANGAFRWARGPACAPPDEDEATRNTLSTKLALRYTLEHPDEELALIPKRFVHMMEQDHDGLGAVESNKAGAFLGDRLRTNLGRVADVYFFVTGLLALASLGAYFRGRRPDRFFTGIAILTLLAVPLLLWGNIRFHVPLLPFYALGTAVSLQWLRDRLRPDQPTDESRDGAGGPAAHHVDAPADDEVGAGAR
jgi:hypothetical protein